MPARKTKRNPLTVAELALRDYAMSFPTSVEEFPWGHRAIKVNKKAFVFLSHEDGVLRMSVKLPESCEQALQLPFVSSTRYGLGKSGWVTAEFNHGSEVPLEMLQEWIGESFRAIAPKRLVVRR